GMKSQEITVGNKTTINLALEEETVGVDEVVVVGYGTQKRSDVIGAVATIKSEDIIATRATSLQGALQGRASGLQITPSNGNPGASMKVMIRGLSTISSNSDPLWVVDGTPTGDITNINPNDIASIEVLKDAGATAIYGSRGANGVIMVTTKTATANKKSTTINYTTGISEMSRTAEDMGIANTSDWFKILDLGTDNVGAPRFNGNLNTFMDFPLASSKGYKSLTRAQAILINNSPDDFFRKGNFHDLNLSTALGFDKAQMFFSMNYRSDKGLEKDNSADRLSLRMNLDYELMKNVKIGSKVNLTYINANSGANQFATVMGSRQSWYPIEDAEDPTGYWNPYSGNAATEMRTQSEYVDNTLKSYRAMVANYIEYTVPFVKGLSIKANANVDQSIFTSSNWTSAMIRDIGTASASDYTMRGSNTLLNAYINYKRDFGDHNISFVGGAERQSTKGYEYRLSGTGLSSPFHELGYMPANKNDMYAGGTAERYIGSYFGRLGYHFKNKYMLEGSLRRDGSSAFDVSKRYGVFPALALGWLISDESFFKPLTSVISSAKFRGSVGKTGNQQIPNGTSVLTWRSPAGNWGGAANQGTSGSSPDNIPNKDVTWETTTSYDAGLDFGLFKNRVSGSFGYYMKDVDGLLVALNVPVSAGSNSGAVWKNIGRIKTQGIEFDLRWVNLQKGDITWSSTFNFTTTHNKIVTLNPEIDQYGKGIIQGGASYNGATYIKASDAVAEFYMAEEAGINAEHGYPEIWELDQALWLEKGQTVRTGKKIPATIPNIKANRFIEKGKTGLPTYFGSFGNELKYKNFDMNFLFTFSGGNYLYNEFIVNLAQPALMWGPASNQLLTEAWTKPGDVAKYGQVRYGGKYDFDDAGNPSTTGGSWGEGQNPSTRFLEKGDFIRLKNLQIGYNLPQKRLTTLGISNLRVYLAATNLFTITSYSGWDPEIVRSENLLSGFTGVNMP
ncbi:SusC/RagA family TonB-linked outer membrane protein, partial [bacterium]|nr:SusC/RagA family TonB-linked outer membrane protein [bacterium]